MSFLTSGIRRVQAKTMLGINWRNPITRDLQVAINGAFAYDAARQLTPDLNTAKTVSTENGECLNFDGSSNTRHQYYTSPISTNDTTIFAIARAFAYDSTIMGAFCIGATRNNNYIAIDVDPGNIIAVTRQDASYNIAYGRVATAGTWHKMLATFNATQRTILVDNDAEVVSVVSLAPTGMNTIIAGGWVDNTDSFASGLNGDLRIGLMWGRVLAPIEKQSIMDNPDQVFLNYFTPNYYIPRYGQILRPNGVVSAGSWVSSLGGSLEAAINEATPNLNTFIYTVEAGTCEISLTDPNAPISLIDDILRYCCAADSGTMKFSLMQGVVEIASWIHAPAPTTPTFFAQPLNSGQVAAITDYSSLTLKIEAY